MLNETIHTIGGCRLNKTEIDILQCIACSEDIGASWPVLSLAEQTDTFFCDALSAIDTLVLEGLLHNDADTFVSPTDINRSVLVTDGAIEFLNIYVEELNSLYLMLDTDVYELDEMAVA